MPKALVEIGAQPILWHVIEIYVRQGFRRFWLCTGYRGEMIEEFVAGCEWPEGVEIECVDTGLDTPTGGRVARIADRLEAGPFCVTYADGVADIDLHALRAFHRESGMLATVTVVQPTLQWGLADIDGEDRIKRFVEKPRSEHWVNGGFFCFEPGALAYFENDSVLEREPLERLAADGQLAGYRHSGFWDCMDTYKDAVVLNDLWQAGDAPWFAGGSDREPASPARTVS